METVETDGEMKKTDQGFVVFLRIDTMPNSVICNEFNTTKARSEEDYNCRNSSSFPMTTP